MELRTARRIAQLTQQQLADKANVDPATISNLENDRRHYGKVSYEQIVRIARALNIEPEELFPVPHASSETPAVNS